MYALVRKWESSGQSQLKFLEPTGISKSAFGYWRKKFLEEHGPRKPASGRLIPINVHSDNKLSMSDSQSLEIIYPNGVRLLCPVGMNLTSIKELIV